ncbi:hypothetical protein CJF32_00000472 [Rutstroemia sp. NJR-2017a WRK4]|nr:hypothetical protein CJF32_00000472 [Rutstroemia sp. NJR-2017a WRK4]
MGPSQNEQPFTRKAIAKAFFGLDSSDNELSDDHVGPVASQPLTTNEIKERNEVTLLTLPAEIRLRIYDYLLISRFDRRVNPSCAVGNTDQKQILLSMIRDPQYRTMEPTCKQIYREAISLLYTQNVFAVSEPEQMFRLSMQIGIKNFKLIRTLDVWVPHMAKISPWLQFLHMLAKEASGLRHMKLGWGADTEFSWQFERGDPGRGLGDNLHFVRALGKIQGLEKLVIKGYYAKKWPAYLRERMGAQVVAMCAHCPEDIELREGELVGEKLEHVKSIRELYKRQIEAFAKYQQGTEDLIP